jgi:hypothetical protein
LSDELVTIYSFRGSEEANLWKEKLHAHGIKSVVVNDYNYGATLQSNELKVKASDVARAKIILKPLRKIGPVPATPASAWLLFFLGMITLVPGVIVLFFTHDTDILPAAILLLIFGGFFTVISLLAMVRRKKVKR